MKITFVMASGFSMGGGDRVIATYAEQLQRRGHDLLVVNRQPAKPGVRRRIRSLLQGKGWFPSSRIMSSHFDGVGVPRKLVRGNRPVGDEDVPDADVVIATWWETAHWIHAMAPAKGRKIYFVQGHEVFDAEHLTEVRASYRLPMHKIAVSRWLVDVMASEYGDHDVSYVPNSVDTSLFWAPRREKNRIPAVGLVYSPARLKGCDIGLAAFALAKRRVPGLRLIVLTSVPEDPDLPIPREAEVFRNPPQATIRDVYAKCDAWIFCSRAEGFGLPIMEAMACRTPVIGTPAGAAPELLGSGNGVLVKAEDPEDMARGIVAVCSLSADAWLDLSDRAYHRTVAYPLRDAVAAFELALAGAGSGHSQGSCVARD